MHVNRLIVAALAATVAVGGWVVTGAAQQLLQLSGHAGQIDALGGIYLAKVEMVHRDQFGQLVDGFGVVIHAQVKIAVVVAAVAALVTLYQHRGGLAAAAIADETDQVARATTNEPENRIRNGASLRPPTQTPGVNKSIVPASRQKSPVRLLR